MLTPDNLKKEEPMTHEQIHDYLIGLGFEHTCKQLKRINHDGKESLGYYYLYYHSLQRILIQKSDDTQSYLFTIKEEWKPYTYTSNNLKIILDEIFNVVNSNEFHDDFLDATTYFLQTSLFKKETTMEQPTWEIFDDKGSKIGGYLTLDTFLCSYESNQKSLDAHLNKKVIAWTTYAEFGKMEQPDPTKFEWVGEMMSYKDFTILCKDESVYKAKLVKPVEPKFKTEDLVLYKNKIWYVTGFDGKCYSLKDKNGYGDIALADDIKAVTFEDWSKEHLPENMKLEYKTHEKGYRLVIREGCCDIAMAFIKESWLLDKQIAIAQAYIDAVESEKKCDSE